MTEKKDTTDLEDLMKQAAAGITEKTEMAEVTKEFSENKPSSSNLTDTEQRLAWRGKSILKRVSPKSAAIIDDFVDTKRSVGGWNTNKKVEAISGMQNQRSGGIMNKLFSPKTP